MVFISTFAIFAMFIKRSAGQQEFCSSGKFLHRQVCLPQSYNKFEVPGPRPLQVIDDNAIISM